MNTYRVDRAPEGPTPCGMVSILYLGDDIEEALTVYNYVSGGRSPWGSERPDYGVMLSAWNPNLGNYIPKRFKTK